MILIVILIFLLIFFIYMVKKSDDIPNDSSNGGGRNARCNGVSARVSWPSNAKLSFVQLELVLNWQECLRSKLNLNGGFIGCRSIIVCF